MSEIKHAVIPVAGYGTRVKEFGAPTKALLRVGDPADRRTRGTPMIDIILGDLALAGIEHCIVVEDERQLVTAHIKKNDLTDVKNY